MVKTGHRKKETTWILAKDGVKMSRGNFAPPPPQKKKKRPSGVR